MFNIIVMNKDISSILLLIVIGFIVYCLCNNDKSKPSKEIETTTESQSSYQKVKESFANQEEPEPISSDNLSEVSDNISIDSDIIDSDAQIIVNNNPLNFAEAKKAMEEQNLFNSYNQLFKDKKNIKIIQEAMFSSTNEIMGTSYGSRINDPKYQFAGKTGTAQVKRISKRERELDLKLEQIPYKNRDHALYVAFGPYKNPKYALSIIVEHGGSGSKAAAPMAKELFKLIIDRDELRKKQPNFEEINI